MQTPIDLDIGGIITFSSPLHAPDMQSVSSLSSKAKLVGNWTNKSKFAMLQMAEQLRLWIHQHGKMEAHYIAIVEILQVHFGLVCSVISLPCKYNLMLEMARKQAVEDAKITGEVALGNEMQLLAAKLASMEDDSRELSEVSLF